MMIDVGLNDEEHCNILLYNVVADLGFVSQYSDTPHCGKI